MEMPVIAVTGSAAAGSGPERTVLNAVYLRAVERAGGLPVVLPPYFTRATTEAFLGLCDGVVLTGGADVNPRLYGEEPHETVSGWSDERDALERQAIEYAFERGMPVLAICRGMQMVNVALGGTLIQDIPSAIGGEVSHQQTPGTGREVPTHEIRIEAGTALAGLMGGERVRVNSMHHQAVGKLGAGLRAIAWTDDEVVEAIELRTPGNRWLVAVQWHPEELAGTSDGDRRLFAAHVEAARGWRAAGRMPAGTSLRA